MLFFCNINLGEMSDFPRFVGFLQRQLTIELENSLSDTSSIGYLIINDCSRGEHVISSPLHIHLIQVVPINSLWKYSTIVHLHFYYHFSLKPLATNSIHNHANWSPTEHISICLIVGNIFTILSHQCGEAPLPLPTIYCRLGIIC